MALLGPSGYEQTVQFFINRFAEYRFEDEIIPCPRDVTF